VRQFTNLKIGIIGYGRLGIKYSKYMLALNSKVFVYDPLKKIKNLKLIQLKNLKRIFKICDVISLHVHVQKNTVNMINSKLLSHAKDNLLLINTSRGELINEEDLIKFLKKNKEAKYAADVLNNEIKNKKKNKILNEFKNNNQILITPHIGGMTIEAQEIAYGKAIDLTNKFLSKI
jgi:D-3-phosphoglycerate dehydrogenase